MRLFRSRDEAPVDDLRRDTRVARRDLPRDQPMPREERVVSRETSSDAPSYVERETRTEYRERAAPVVEERVTEPAIEESVMTDRHFGYLSSFPARVNAVLFAVLVAVEALIGLRFTMLAFGASRSSGFVRFIYDFSWPFVRPFSNAFSNRTTDSGLIEVSSLLAMGVWLLLFILVSLIVNALLPHVEDRDSSVRRERVTHV